MGRHTFLLTVLAGVGVAAPGCASYTSFKEARALDPGTIRFDVAMVAQDARPRVGATAFRQGAPPDPSDTTEQPQLSPGFEAQVRYGFAPGFDLGLKTSLSSLEVNGTIQLVRGERFDLALAPALQGAVGTNGDDEGWSMMLFKLPLLADFRFGDAGKHAVVVGPALAKAWGSGMSKNSGYTIDAMFAGGTIGVSFAAGPSVRIMPEIAVYSTLRGHGVALPRDAVRVSPDVGLGRPVLLQAGVGVAFGSTGDTR